jgi:hypothetical protein
MAEFIDAAFGNPPTFYDELAALGSILDLEISFPKVEATDSLRKYKNRRASRKWRRKNSWNLVRREKECQKLMKENKKLKEKYNNQDMEILLLKEAFLGVNKTKIKNLYRFVFYSYSKDTMANEFATCHSNLYKEYVHTTA